MGGMGSKKDQNMANSRRAAIASGANDGSVSSADSGNGLDNNSGNQVTSKKNFTIPNARGLKRGGKLFSKSKPRRLGR